MGIIQRLKRWLEFKRNNIKVWYPCNIYPSAKIGKGVSIGMYSEIGHNVIIGEGTRIGKGTFIPEGVCIGKDCFIGPHTCFSNDMYPMSPKNEWKKTTVCDAAAIGAGVKIRPGVIIGSNTLIGMGAVVTKNIPDNEIWSGVPAKKMLTKGINNGS